MSHQEQMNFDLLKACQNCDDEAVIALLNQGASPRAVFHPVGRDDFYILNYAIAFSTPEIIELILKHCIANKIAIKLAVHPADRQNKYGPNIFQDACLFGGIKARKLLIEYAKNTGQDLKALINAPIIMKDQDGKDYKETFGTALIKSFGTFLIGANLKLKDSDSPETFYFISNNLSEWCSDKSSNGEINIDRTVIDDWQGPVSTIKHLLTIGLDPDATNVQGLSLRRMVTNFAKWDDKPENWDNHIRPILGIEMVESIEEAEVIYGTTEAPTEIAPPQILQIGKAQKNEETGEVYINALVRNFYGLHPIKWVFNINYQPSLDAVYENDKRLQAEAQEAARIAAEATAAAAATQTIFAPLIKQHEETTAGLAALRGEVATVKTEVTTVHTKVDKVHEEVKGLAAIKIKSIRDALSPSEKSPGYPNSLKFFEIVYARLKIELKARLIATSTIFAAKPTTRTAMIAETTQTVFAAAMQSSGLPLAGVIPAITGALIKMATQSYANYQSEGVFNVMLGTSPKEVAMAIAAILTNEMMKHKTDAEITTADTEKIAGIVVGNVNTLHNLESQADLVGYLCTQPISLMDKLDTIPNAIDLPLATTATKAAPEKRHSDESSVPASSSSDEGKHAFQHLHRAHAQRHAEEHQKKHAAPAVHGSKTPKPKPKPKDKGCAIS